MFTYETVINNLTTKQPRIPHNRRTCRRRRRRSLGLSADAAL
jgi:hypothetical protein